MKMHHVGFLAFTLTSVAVLASANAADMYRAPQAGGYKDGPVYAGIDWTGAYGGVNGGYGWDASSIGDALAPFDISPAGGFAGGQIGYNIQRGHIVFGVEADIQASDISDSSTVTVGNTSATIKSKLDWFGTVRARLGYAADRNLVYITGGLAYG